ncbi:Trk system potassium transporter TrkA [Deltaproteobacteria bacterium Smac51]|nr:Trk system potassium transporter TrkA [Deltaproteobacteria bacterium Smac51]
MRVIVVGAGEVGYHIAAKLVKEQADVILIDRDRDRLNQVAESLDVQTVTGFGANPETLAAAGLSTAELVVAVTGNDETNILVCRMAQLMAQPDTRRVARIRAAGYYEFFGEKKLRSDFGINLIINPSWEAVETIIDFIEFPGASDVIDVARGQLKLVGMRLPRKHHLLGKPLMELLPRDRGIDVLIAAIYRRHDLVIPKGDTILRPGDLVYVAASSEDSKQVHDFFGLDPEPIKNVVIIGGGEVGYLLAKRLENDERRFNIKLIELDGERAEYLSARLKKTMVLKGDGTDQDLLMDESAGDCDVFIAVSTDDEKNLISCLLAKRLGARHTITRVNRFSYAQLVSSIGLEAMVSARLAAVSAVLKNIRRGRVISVATLANEDAEIIEYQVMPKSKAAGHKLMEIKFPEGALILALIRGEAIIIPKGNTVIDSGDILAVVAKGEAISSLEKLLGGK